MIAAVADDFTGATDVAVAFQRANLRTVIVFGTPHVDDQLPDADAFVIALKTRTIPAAEAVEQAISATAWLRDHGVSQVFFKYCSTFDSRPDGNIGPVADSLAAFLDAPRVVFVPSSPRHLRTQYMGHLFVDQMLLSDSPMRHHPLTPMTNSYIPDVLQAQTSEQVGLIDHRDVVHGAQRISQLLDATEQTGIRYVVIDALTDADLNEIGEACLDDRLLTGAAGLAAGFGVAHAGRLGRAASTAADTPSGSGLAAVIAGSCSARTLEQLAAMMRNGNPAHRLDAVAHPNADTLAVQALDWYDQLDTPTAAPLIYSSLPPEELRRTQQALGTDRASDILEAAQGIIAKGLRDRGVRRLVIAGGETSGAVVSALEVRGGLIGPEAASGVPWIITTGEQPVALLLKSGNFGDPDLLVRASQPELASA